MRRIVSDIDPNVPVSEVQTMDDVVAQANAARRFTLG